VAPTQVSGFLSWVVDGCDGRPGWWLCPPPIDPEFEELASAVLGPGFFLNRIDHGLAVVG
jgi:hypothetical protein